VGLYDRLSGDSTLTNMLSTFKTNPAIFTGNRVPEKAQFPYVHIPGELADPALNEMDTKNKQGRVLTREVRCFNSNPFGSDVVESIADRVHDLLHERPGELTISGWQVVIIQVSGPVGLPTEEDDASGRSLSVEVQIQKS